MFKVRGPELGNIKSLLMEVGLVYFLFISM